MLEHPDQAVNPALEKLFDPTLIVKDANDLKEYSDPLCSKENVMIGYAVEALRCRQELPKLVCEINLPMLMMIGEDDYVVSQDGLEMMLNCKRHNLLANQE